MSKAGLISDTHDRLDKVRAAVEVFERVKPEVVIHCGDYVAQFTLVELGKLSMPLRGVFGNNDGDRPALLARGREFGFTIEDGPVLLELGGSRFAVSHEPMPTPDDVDFYVHGHTHFLVHQPGKVTTINPGEACGWLTGRSTVAVLDTETRDVGFIDL